MDIVVDGEADQFSSARSHQVLLVSQDACRKQERGREMEGPFAVLVRSKGGSTVHPMCWSASTCRA